MNARGFLASTCGLLGFAALYVGARAQDPVGPPAPSPLPVTPIFRALDVDKDGELSSQEIDGASAALRTLDADKDGKLSRDEALGNFGRRPPADPAATVAWLLRHDKDKDGRLSIAELPDRMKALMDRADADKDGFLDKDELAEYARRPRTPVPRPETAPKPQAAGDPR